MAETVIFATPQEAEAAFYAAFERCDFEAMMSVWAQDEAVCCIHPGGPRLQGPAAVKASWREILGSGERLRFELLDVRCTQGPRLAVHRLRERILAGGVLRGVALTTNVYQLEAGGWRMLVHHASPDPQAGRHGSAPAGPLH